MQTAMEILFSELYLKSRGTIPDVAFRELAVSFDTTSSAFTALSKQSSEWHDILVGYEECCKAFALV